MITATPFRMFQNAMARPALQYYAAMLPDCHIDPLVLVPYGEPGAGTVRMAGLVIGTQRFRVIDSAIPHAFAFTPSLSIFLDIDDAAVFDVVFRALAEGGSTLMEAGDYGFSRRFGWVNDRFGVSWQINLPHPA
jgi:predicted 3-demethylubiquinone-9 3-methyltransferase (glyoxalase superfamily)